MKWLLRLLMGANLVLALGTLAKADTLWFGGDNYSGFVPAIDFGPFPGGDFEAVISSDQPGTAYEATRSLIAVPEPAILVELLGVAVVAVSLMGRRRRDRAATCR